MTKLYAGDHVRIIRTGELGIISAEHLGTEPRRFDVSVRPGPKDKKPTTLTCTEDELEPLDQGQSIVRRLLERPERSMD